MSDILANLAIALDNALYKGGFLVQNDGEAHQIAKVALSAIEASGYRLVPVEPTEKMLTMAFAEALVPSGDAIPCYHAMLAAAPKIT